MKKDAFSTAVIKAIAGLHVMRFLHKGNGATPQKEVLGMVTSYRAAVMGTVNQIGIALVHVLYSVNLIRPITTTY